MAERFACSIDEEAPFISKQEIISQMEHIGIKKGMLLLVHANTRNIGCVMGGSQTIIEALMEVVGYEGTIVMPSFTPQLKDPACNNKQWNRDEWNDLRLHIHPFDKKLSEPFGSDALVYQFLRNEAVARSYHPLYSFAAWGKYAKLICDKHPLHFALGKESPLGKVFEFNGFCFMLGCDFDACIMFQMAKYHEELFPIHIISAPIEHQHERIWKKLLDVNTSTAHFTEIGEMMEDKHVIKMDFIGNGRCRFFSTREAYHVATTYFAAHHDGSI